MCQHRSLGFKSWQLLFAVSYISRDLNYAAATYHALVYYKYNQKNIKMSDHVQTEEGQYSPYQMRNNNFLIFTYVQMEHVQVALINITMDSIIRVASHSRLEIIHSLMWYFDLQLECWCLFVILLAQISRYNTYIT
jgi:hypothetical protein